MARRKKDNEGKMGENYSNELREIWGHGRCQSITSLVVGTIVHMHENEIALFLKCLSRHAIRAKKES